MLLMKALKNEKIDVIEWNKDTKQFVTNALLPAKIKTVVVDDEGKRAVAIVPDNELSIAIGKEGINVRLASKLTGMKIDIKTVSDVKKMEEEHQTILDRNIVDIEKNDDKNKKEDLQDEQSDALDDIMKKFEAVIADSSDDNSEEDNMDLKLGVDWDEDA